MFTHIFITGTQTIPSQLRKEQNYKCTLVENAYDLRVHLQETQGEKIIVAYLPFLEIRHFDIFAYLQKNIANVKTFFVVDELSAPMKLRLKSNRDFVVLWKTEQHHLAKDIQAYLGGKDLELRQDKREEHSKRPLISPSLLPAGLENRGFQAILAGSFTNISPNGSCIKIKAAFYNRKDFINLTYQTKEGEYVSIEGQVRWTKWNPLEQSQELGVQFLTLA